MRFAIAMAVLFVLSGVVSGQAVDYTVQGGPSCYISTTAWCYAGVLTLNGSTGGTIWAKQDGELRFYDASGNLAWTSTDWNPTTGAFVSSLGVGGTLDLTYSQVRTCRRGQCYYYTHISGGSLVLN